MKAVSTGSKEVKKSRVEVRGAKRIAVCGEMKEVSPREQSSQTCDGGVS